MLILGFIAGFSFFTNCSRNPENASIPNTAFLSPEAQNSAFKEQFSDRVPASFCNEDFSYSCQRRVYSASVPNSTAQGAHECAYLNEIVKICPAIQNIQFNTKAAQQNCQDCNETYEYLEYSCHLKIPNEEGLYPITATKPTLNESLYELFQTCTSIAYGNTEKQ